jgi:translation initiation factor 2-alpha kinase 4
MVAKFESALSHRLMNKTREEARSFGVLTPNRCDVYVGTYPDVAISYRLQIVGELWRSGIRADLQYDDGRLEPELLNECKEQNILFLVMVRAPRPQRADVKVIRVLTGKSDDDGE